MVDDLDLDALERVAMAVPPGPWEVFDGTLISDVAGAAERLADACEKNHAAFIATANPATILELIHRLRTAEAAVTQGQADLLALSAALAEARDNDRAAMGWLVDARAASGDDGKRMLPEFVEYLKELRADAERYQWLINAPATWTPDPVRHWLWSRPCDASRLTITIDDAISEAKKLGGAAPAEISF